ncbi:MAG: glucodextranase DOMON-like domain-containing protein [Thermoprotei archaeon]|nr:glucodextranase DOMON-like domain-containing protein [Thermoprotei archaeon]
MRLVRAVVAVVLLTLLISPAIMPAYTQSREPLYVIFVWHYHQPWYYDAGNSSFLLPWVRMHSVGNYYKMAYILSKYEDVKATFTFSGSLLEQLLDYVYGGKEDYRLTISRKLAAGEILSVEERFSMLQIPGGFFDINWGRIVNVVPKYREFRDRAQSAFTKYIGLPEDGLKKAIVSEFSEQDFLDLACLFNLFWVDPQVLREKYPSLYDVRVKYLRNADYKCTRQVLSDILRAQLEVMGEIPGIYGGLLSKGQVEVIPVPYSHPLAPILTAFGLSEDLEVHVDLSLKLFDRIFNYKPSGVWPAELAVNEDVLKAFSVSGFTWAVADDTVLFKSVPGLPKASIAGVLYADRYVWSVDFNGKLFYVFFRNSELSNLIGFTYSNMPSKNAAQDLVSRLKSIASAKPGGVVVIALDGENPWEHYEEFGDIFLNELYNTLREAQKEGVLKTVTPSEYLKLKGGQVSPLPPGKHLYLKLKGVDISDIPASYFDDAYAQLPREAREARIAEGSWAGGELAVWIGQRQENAAWMLLIKARDDVFKALNVPSFRELLKVNYKAAKLLLMAEASDWTWWYGGDGGGFFPSNPLFKGYLNKAYEISGLKAPPYLEALFNPDGTPIGVVNAELPKPVDSLPELDGGLSEPLWANALKVNVGPMFAPEVLIAVSPSGFILGFNIKDLKVPGLKMAVYLTNWWRSVSPYNIGYNSVFRDGSLAPMALSTELLLDPGKGILMVNVADGLGGWVNMFILKAGVREAVEAFIPWNLLLLSPGDYSYIIVTVYVEDKIVERSDRLGMTHLIQVPRVLAVAEGRTVFEALDPEGDDDGAGGYKHPLNPVFKPGVFDMLGFKVLDMGATMLFEARFKSLGGNPWGGPNGFSLQYIHIYIKTTLEFPGRNETFGLNVVLDSESMWHMAILIAPGWGSDPVPKGERAAIYYYNGSIIVQDGGFKVYADPAMDSIIAEVPKSMLLDVGNAGKWVYTVIVTSYDGYGPERIRPFGVNAEEWVVGAGVKYAQAILFNVVPRVMDILAPTREDQYAMLNTFEIIKEKNIARMAAVKGLSATQPITLPAVTVTHTETTPITYTETETRVVEVERTATWASLLASLAAGLLLGSLVTLILLRKRGRSAPA